MSRLAVLLGFGLSGCGSAPAVLDGQASTVLTNARIISMDDPGIMEGHGLIVREGTIEWVGPMEDLAMPHDAQVIDLQSRFVLPGLADMHVHSATERELASYVRYGVTTVLHMGDQLGRFGAGSTSLDLRDQIVAGQLFGPNMLVVGRVHAGGWSQLGVTTEAGPSTAARSVLRAHRTSGYDFFKVHNLFDGEVLQHLTAAGSMPIVGHLPVDLGADAALASGLAMIAHAGLFYYKLFFDNGCLATGTFWECVAGIEPDESQIPRIVRGLAEQGTYVTPNLSYYALDSIFSTDFERVIGGDEFTTLPSSVQDNWANDGPETRSFPENRMEDIEKQLPFSRTLTRAMFEAGIPLLMGTDAPLPGLFPGLSAHQDLQQLVIAGLSPEDALRTATRNAGDFVQLHSPEHESFGRIAEGYRADVMVVEQNPLEDIEALSTIWGVMLRGELLSLPELDALRMATPH